MLAIPVEIALQIADARYQAGQWAEAEGLCREILRADPDYAPAHFLSGIIALQSQQSGPALAALSRAVSLAPANPDYHCELGLGRRLTGDACEAIACFRRALALNPDHFESHLNLGDSLTFAGQWNEALAVCERAVKLRPDSVTAHCNLGNVLKARGRVDEAIVSYQQALAVDPFSMLATYNLGSAFLESERYGEAIACFQRVVTASPDFAEAWLNLGTAHFHQGSFGQAMPSYRRAIALRAEWPLAHLHLALLLLLLERSEEAWREFEWRLEKPPLHGSFLLFPPTMCGGDAVPGKTILVSADGGFGDTIYFFRYLPHLVEKCGANSIVFECQPELYRLLIENGIRGLHIIARSSAEAPDQGRFEEQIPLLSLPLALRHFEEIPCRPYLQANLQQRARWRELIGPPSSLRVGIVWAGNPKHRNDRLRSISTDSLRPILEVQNVTFYSLQIQNNLPAKWLPPQLIDLTNRITDFSDTAAFIAELDLVISVDTSVAHLAGALGVPVWTLLPFVPDWRWGSERMNTLSYPTMRLFRQAQPGDWGGAILRIVEELHSLATE